jgi:mono/diheme cytochrome c family protein
MSGTGSFNKENPIDLMKKLFAASIGLLAAAALSVHAGDAKATYEQHCAKCHGADGKGQTKMGEKLGAKDYTNPKVQEELTDAAAIKAIKEGFKNAEGKTVMRPTEGLSDEDIKGLVAYMRSFKK